MTKNEFLNILRQSLEGEINPNEIEQNIRYYDQYIGIRPADEEERILNTLGNPRLIAKTIIEANKAAKQKDNRKGNENHSYSYYGAQNQETDTNQDIQRKGFKWYHKIALFVSILIFLLVVFVVGGVLLKVLFTIGFPVILILLLLLLFRKQ